MERTKSAWCSYHKTTTHSDADCRARRRKPADGNAHVTAAGPSRVKEVCSAYDLPEEEDQPERPYTSFTATEVHPTAATGAEQSQKAATWPFGSLLASRSWLFEERSKPAITLGGHEKPDFYTYGGTDGEGEPLYGVALRTSGPAEIKRKLYVNGYVVHVLVCSGASDHYFDDLIIPELKHRLQETSLITPRTILTAGGAMVDGTAEGVIQGIITDDYGEQHLARIAILNVPGIGRNLFSVKTAAKKGIVSIFDVNNPRLEASDTVPFHGEDDGLYSFKLDLSADGYVGKKLAINAVTKCGIGGWVTLTCAALNS